MQRHRFNRMSNYRTICIILKTVNRAEWFFLDAIAWGETTNLHRRRRWACIRIVVLKSNLNNSTWNSTCLYQRCPQLQLNCSIVRLARKIFLLQAKVHRNPSKPYWTNFLRKSHHWWTIIIFKHFTKVQWLLFHHRLDSEFTN